MTRQRVDYPARLAECQVALAISNHRLEASRSALLLHLEAQIIGTIVRDGRYPLGLLMMQAGDLWSWNGHRLYAAMVFVASLTGPHARDAMHWEPDELIAVAEYATIGPLQLVEYLDHAVPEHVFRNVLSEFAVWMRHA